MNIENKEHEPQITITPAAPEDVRGATEVYYKTWLSTYPNEDAGVTTEDVETQFKDAFTPNGLAERTERMVRPPENRSFFLAKDGDKVVGVCSVTRHPDKNQPQSIYVLPEYQRKGVGALLWQEAQTHFDADKDIMVSVVAYNDNAIKFYQKLGFENIEKQESNKTIQLKSGTILPETEMIIKVKKEQQS